ncbi:putative filament-forming protein [Rosellinia necatrix]|uniref:Putative filament-forming protein n=1 Tax=Rosellinia necatrix TaxID=77044 RepID=A0A1W2TM76_ROSNE|nr:putative filament-forming protein [Rosellinia necatrix]
MAAVGVDVGYLAAHLGVPEANLSVAISDPTVDVIVAILAAVATKAHEFDALFSQKLQLEVELETSVRGAEAQRDASNETAKKALKDVEDLRQKLNQEETKRQTLENELQSLKSSSSASQSDIDTLQSRITSLETSNRESLAIIDTKNSTNETLSQELQAQHQKNLKLSQEATVLQQAVQSANAVAGSAKIREQGLQRQLEAAKRDVEWTDQELKKKTAEALSYRKEKGARIAELQRQNDDAASTVDSLKRSEQQLRQRLQDAQTKAEDALTRIQQLEESAARREEDFQQQVDRLQRLHELTEQQNATQKNRLQAMEERDSQVKRECEEKIQRISKELAAINMDKDELTQANESLQNEIGRLEAMLAAGSGGSPGQPGSAPQTPRPMNGSMFRPSSPFATPGSMRKSISTTQALDEYYKVKGQLSVEKQRSNNLAKDLEDVLEQLQAKAPEVEELYAENERLQSEIKNMSHLSDESFHERDVAKKAARKAESAASQAQAEITILRNQLRDLSAQIQMLLFNMHCQEKGLDELSIEETLHFQRLERGQVEGNADNINSMILQRLVVFKDIQELQEKNEKLLQVTHELGQNMESEEAIAAKNQAVEDHKERIRLQQELDLFRDTLRGFQVKTESITKERDMFRRIVESRVSGDELASALGHQGGVLTSIEQNAHVDVDGSDYATLLEEIRKEFDDYRKEQTTDRKTLKEQIEKLSAERNRLQSEVSRITSQLSLASERFDMLRSNYAALESENKELQRRNQTMSESAAKQDIRTQNVAEELVEARAVVESMRSENANLKAEKNLWQDIQDRLSRDNENLVQEKSRLNGLLATHQTLQNERELADAETKRRLQTSIDALEADLNSTKRKLAGEVEESKKVQQRKEFDAQQSQKRIDELTANLGQIREELVAVKTSKDHLQSRVEELTIQLRSADERAERLQPRPTPRPGSMVSAFDENAAQHDGDERIQELIHEATDLKRDLEITLSQLENAQGQVERYRELSQASEEELERLLATQEQYTQEMDNALAAKEAAIKELEQRVEDLSTELSRSNGELSALRDSQADIARRFEEEKGILEEEVKRLKDQEEHYTSSSQFHQQDLRAQAEIATTAQQAYENEVMKHGETAKALSNVRSEYNQVKTMVAKSKAEAESVKATLMQSESSWDERRLKFEQEILEVRSRWEDANAQNKILHQQLENVTAQISALQESRSASNESLEDIAAQPSSSDADKYRELSNYLRREKDILEVQYELKVQDAKRLQQQLDYTQSQLDEARLKLEQERRSQGDNDRNTMAHKDLMSKLEELNLFRESSAALRTEARQAQAQLTEKTGRIAELESTIQPLEAQIEELQSQQSFKDAEMKQLQEDRDRWQKRTEDILSKHGRTDPAEVEELRQKVASLENERDALREAEAPLRERVQELENSIAAKEAEWAVTREKLVNSAKERSRVLVTAKNQVVAEKEQIQKNFEQVTSELASTKEEMEAFKKAKLELEKQVLEFKRQADALRTETQKNPTSISPSESPALQATLSELQSQLTAVRSELEAVSSQKASIEQELHNTRDQLNSAVAGKELPDAGEAPAQTNGDSIMEDSGEIRQNGPTENPTSPQPLSDDERKKLEDQIAASEARAAEWEAKAKELEQNQDTIVKHRSDKMKEALNKRLSEFKAAMESERIQLQQDKEQLEADFKLRMEQERKIWETEQASGQNATNMPSTPRQPKPEAPAATPGTSILDLNGLGDQEIRELVSKNATVRSIVQNNIKSKLAAETKKMKEEHEASTKTEWEQKLAQAKESATQLVTSKMNLKLNMTENRARMANAKIEVVETAAKETPERPVGEVWEIAKVTKPPPAPKPPAAPAALAALAIPAVSAGPTESPDSTAPTSQPVPSGQISAPQGVKPTPPSSIPPKPITSNAPQQANPFATSQQNQIPQVANAVNPFAQNTLPTPQQHQAVPSGLPQPVHSSTSQLPKVSNLPLPGGARKPSGPQIPRGGARGGGPQRGRGGGGHQGRASLNPSVDSFQPGAKRPRGDSEIGNGSKRARGGGGPGA